MIDSCCLKKFDHEGTPIGEFKLIGGLDSYFTGNESYDKVIVFITDIFGYKLKNTHLVADGIAKMTGMKVIIPDILNDDPLTDFSKRDEWFGKHGPPLTKPIVEGFFEKFISEYKCDKIFAIGFCFGAYFIPDLLSESGPLTSGAIVHPGGVPIESFEKVTKPILISVGANDKSYGEELRNGAINVLEKNKIRYQLCLFQDAPHGFEIKGDMSIPIVKYAKEKTMLDQAYFFSSFI